MSTTTHLQRVSVLIPAAHVDTLRAQAEAEHRTLSQELRRLIAEHLSREDVAA